MFLHFEVEALLSRCLQHIKYRESPTLELKRFAAIPEVGIVGDVVVDAMVAIPWRDFFGLCGRHLLSEWLRRLADFSDTVTGVSVSQFFRFPAHPHKVSP